MRSAKPQRAHPAHPQDEIAQDMLPLFALLDDGSASPDAGVEQLMMTLLATEDLIEEPEFEEMFIDPIRCVDTFAEVGEELGIDPDSLSQLPEEEREETMMEMLLMTTQQLLTDELRQDVIDALNELRLRLKRAGKREKAAKAAALQSFLGESEDRELWSTIGLVRAIVQRSLAAGFELLDASMELVDVGGLDESETPLTISEKVNQSRLAKTTSSLLQRIPGLSGFMEKEADRIWEEGIHAVFEGDLCLGIFTTEELEAGLDIFGKTLGGAVIEETASQDPTTLTVSEETFKTLIAGMDDYITELFTPERLDQLRARLNTILGSSDFTGKWLAFIMMLVEYMADEEAVENEKWFLISAFLGEIRSVSEALEEDTDE